MTIQKNPLYQEYQPAAGSPLYLALEVYERANAAADEAAAVVTNLKTRREQAAGIVQAADWTTGLDKVIQAQAQIPVLDAMIQKAEQEQRRRIDDLRHARKAVEGHVNPLRDAQAAYELCDRNLSRLEGMIAAGDKFPNDTLEALKVRLVKAERQRDNTRQAQLTAA